MADQLRQAPGLARSTCFRIRQKRMRSSSSGSSVAVGPRGQGRSLWVSVWHLPPGVRGLGSGACRREPGRTRQHRFARTCAGPLRHRKPDGRLARDAPVVGPRAPRSARRSRRTGTVGGHSAQPPVPALQRTSFLDRATPWPRVDLGRRHSGGHRARRPRGLAEAEGGSGDLGVTAICERLHVRPAVRLVSILLGLAFTACGASVPSAGGPRINSTACRDSSRPLARVAANSSGRETARGLSETPESGAGQSAGQAVVVMSGLGSWDPMFRAVSLLKGHGVFSSGVTGCGWRVVVAPSDAPTARAILEADEQCSEFLRR